MRKFWTDLDVDVLLGHAVHPPPPDRRGQLGIGRGHGAAVTDAADVLGRVEANRPPPARPERDRTVGLGGVLHDRARPTLQRQRARAARTGGPAMIARVRSVTAAAQAPRSIAAVSTSTSTGTGAAPTAHTADAVGTAVKAGTITSSPGPMPSAGQRQLDRPGSARHATTSQPPLQRRPLAFEGVELRAEQHRARATICGGGRLERLDVATVPRRVRSTTGTTGGPGRTRRSSAMPSAKAMRGAQPSTRLAFVKSPWKLPMSMRSSAVGPRHRTMPAAGPAASAIEPGDLGERRRLGMAEVEDLADGVGSTAASSSASTTSSTWTQSRSCWPSPNSVDRLAEQGVAHEDRQEPEAVRVEVLAGAVDVGEAQRRRPQVVDRRVEQVELLARQLVDAVHVDRARRVVLVDGQVLRTAVHLAGRRLHDRRRGARPRRTSSRKASWLRTLRSRSRSGSCHRARGGSPGRRR